MKNKLVILAGIMILLLAVLPACNSKTEALPRSMKGYELYSWQDAGQWHFTLITGTNRNKTLEEIVTGDNVESKDGWVRIQVTGIEKITAVLKRVPAGEWISWNSGEWMEPEKQVDIKLAFPSQDIKDSIKEYAIERGLNFMVPPFD